MTTNPATTLVLRACVTFINVFFHDFVNVTMMEMSFDRLGQSGCAFGVSHRLMTAFDGFRWQLTSEDNLVFTILVEANQLRVTELARKTFQEKPQASL